MSASFIVLALWLAQPTPDVTPGGCNFDSLCYRMGTCSSLRGINGSISCQFNSDDECRNSSACTNHGWCSFNPVKRRCEHKEAADCGPESAACRYGGNCKEGPDSERVGHKRCVPTREGCKLSVGCRVFGDCVTGRPADFLYDACMPNRASCSASVSCKQFGWCQHESKSSTCSSGAKTCETTDECREYGECHQRGVGCRLETSADCGLSRNCTAYGRCFMGMKSCAYKGSDPNCAIPGCVARVEADCQVSELCTRFGACIPHGYGCQVAQPTSTCELERVPVKAITASSQREPWDEYTFAPGNLVDRSPRTMWQPATEGQGPYYLTFELERPTRIEGLEIANGFHHYNGRWGPLWQMQSHVRGIAILVPQRPGKRPADLAGYVIHDAFQLEHGALELERPRFASIEVDRFVVEVFDIHRGNTWSYATLSELSPLRCKAP